jgi:hypothetical protein
LFIAKCPELAGIRARILSLRTVDWMTSAVLAPLSLACDIAFPDGKDWRWRRLGSNAGSVRGKMEQFVLPGPLGWQVGEASDAHAVRESAIDGRYDEIGCEEGK